MRSAVKSLAKRVLPPAATRFLKVRVRGEGAVSPVSGTQPHDEGPASSRSAEYVRHLEDRLDVGYVQAAKEGLHQLIDNLVEPPSVRAEASIVLARWEMQHNRLESALEALRGLIDPVAVSLAADCLCWLGHGRDALARLSVILSGGAATASTMIRVGSARSLIDGSREYGSGWLVTELNRMFLDEGLIPVSRRRVQERPEIGNLVGSPPRYEPQDGAPLVSVIVPAFNCAETIEASIESLLAQSWGNLEVIVVDAGSSDGTPDLVSGLVASDPRLRVVAGAEMGSTFRALNLGVLDAKGELVTIQNGLDWSHPQRIEAQAGPLTADGELAASGVSFLAVGGDFLHRAPSGVPGENLIARDVRSVMYRKTILDRIGLWDQASDLADEEHVQRLKAVFGEHGITWVARDVPVILRGVPGTGVTGACAATGKGCLSKAARYRDAYRWWHTSSRFEDQMPFRSDSGPHPFASWADEGSDISEPTGLRGVVVGDLSQTEDVTRVLVDIATRYSGRLGVAHIPAFESSNRAMASEFYEKVAEGDLIQVGLETAARADVVFLTESVLESPPMEALPSISASAAYVLSKGNRTEAASLPAEWEGIPLLGKVDLQSPRLLEVLEAR